MSLLTFISNVGSHDLPQNITGCYPQVKNTGLNKTSVGCYSEDIGKGNKTKNKWGKGPCDSIT